MAQKCVHKGCGKVFTDPEAEDCHYHPGPPEFHEGQKGWKCCKPRVLTFDEFLAIPPCTTGKHSTVDDTPKPVEAKKEAVEVPAPSNTLPIDADIPSRKPIATGLGAAVLAAGVTPRSTTPQPLEEDSDEEGVSIPTKATCKRRGCGKDHDPKVPRDEEECVYHPGAPVFHEGSKGWSCCKRRVLEFDEFMKIEGCKTRTRHCFVGKKKAKTADGQSSPAQGRDGEEETIPKVRSDFYQTPNSVIASFYLKKIDKTRAKVEFCDDGLAVDLDLPTSDGTRYKQKVPLYAPVDPQKSQFRILGTKLELTLIKADGASWQTLRSDDIDTGERIQVGRAGRA